jgi:hypothetical protein
MISERKVCRAVIDRHEVMGNQVAEAVHEAMKDNVNEDQAQKIQQQIRVIFESHTNGLVSTLSKMFSNK